MDESNYGGFCLSTQMDEAVIDDVAQRAAAAMQDLVKEVDC